MQNAKASVFGYMPGGEDVYQIELKSDNIECGIISYGGAIRYLRVPDRQGKLRDVVLGFDSMEDYIAQNKFIGALIGRYANRIGKAEFTLNGRRYPLYANNGANHLHGGWHGFDKHLWSIDYVDQSTARLSLISEDGDEGYPGELRVTVKYRLEGSALIIDYYAKTSAPTLCNLTNHSYFNLDGHDSGSILSHELQLFSSYYTPTDEGSIPTGELAELVGTPMDFTERHRIGERIDSDFQQLKFAGGYDHNWIISGEAGALNRAALAVGGDSGIVMQTYTTMPGVQFYSGNFLDGEVKGKNGAEYPRRSAFCLETQFYPDSPNNPSFPSALLMPDTIYKQQTRYCFSID